MRVSSVTIYDRWGAEIFRGGDLVPAGTDHAWDGRNRGELVERGVYIYVVEVIFNDDDSVFNRSPILRPF